jgi:hypothetical protein
MLSHFLCWCRVRGILDSALAAADSGSAADAATPASVMQQLAQARQLYEINKAASWGVVERVLADVEDAQVGWWDVHTVNMVGFPAFITVKLGEADKAASWGCTLYGCCRWAQQHRGHPNFQRCHCEVG